MKNQFVADGWCRFLRGKETFAESIEQKYAAELAAAGPDEQRKIQARRAEAFRRLEKSRNHLPSAGTLW